MTTKLYETRRGAWHYVHDGYGTDACNYASVEHFEKMCSACYPHDPAVDLSTGTDRAGRVVARNSDGETVLIECAGRLCDYCH
jgi:hypothetical protein